MMRYVIFGCLISLCGALDCQICSNTILPPAACNDTHCAIDCEVKSCPKSGLCITEVALNHETGHEIQTFPLCQPGNRPASTYFQDKQIEGYCEYRNDGKVYCECGWSGCNHVIALPPVFATSNPLLDVTGKKENKSGSDLTIIIGVVAGVLAFVGIMMIAFMVLRRRRQSQFKDVEYESKITANSRLSSDDASTDGVWDESNKHSNFSTYNRYSSSVATQYSRGSRSNGTNHNDPNLPIKLEKVIGRGRFAEVWKGSLHQEDNTNQVVSVKVFQLRNYGAWRQEKEMLTEGWMRHENLIDFYASEKRTIKGRLQYWLVTAYYEQRSLAEYLRNHTMTWEHFCDMAISIANGLAYLHSESDSSGRPKIPIAHRDVKSCNILVKNDCKSCVLADFGLSLKLDPDLSQDELANAGQVGTSRYMAPELLERLVNLMDIELFKRVDVYALALVYWEMANRCEAKQGMASPYTPPFGDKISDHPTKQQMLLLVCRDRQLPTIPDKWRTHSGLLQFTDEILTEAWDYEPEARITARCIFERFNQLRNKSVINDVIDDDEEAKLLEKVKIEVIKLPDEITSTVV